MDPTGPWPCAYTRLAVAGPSASATSTTSEFPQNNLIAATTSSAITPASLYLQTQGGLSTTSPYNTSGFISPPTNPAAYDQVFTPLFHHNIPKSAHTTIKSENDQPTYASFYNQNATTNSPTGATLTWHQSDSNQISPFGILPHESGSGEASEGAQYTNSSYALLNHLAGIKTVLTTRAASPQTKQQEPQQATTNSNSYYRQPTYVDSSAQTINKPTNQTCIVVASQAAALNSTKGLSKTASKANIMYSSNLGRNSDKNRTSTTTTNANLISNTINSSFSTPLSTARVNNQILQMQQHTKAQTKSYPQFLVVEEADRKTGADLSQSDQQEPISYYTIIDGRFTYSAAPGGNTNLQPSRHFVLANSNDVDTARVKTETQYTGGGVPPNECPNTIIVPRRPSPAQSASSQVPSPAYPLYGSPMNSIDSPSPHSTGSSHPSDSAGHIVIYKTNQQNQIVASQTPLDASITRNANHLANNSPVVYSSVITRALDPAKLSEQYQPCWESNDPKQKLIGPSGINLKQPYYNNAHNSQIGALQNVHKIENQVTENILVTTDRPLSSQIQLSQKINSQHVSAPAVVVSNIVQAQSQPPQQPATKGRRRKNANTSKTREQLLSENEFLVNREPPPAHCSRTASESVINMQHQPQQQPQAVQQLQHQQNGGASYYDLARWNIPAKIVGPSINPAMSLLPNQMSYGNHLAQQQPPIMMSHTHTPSIPYYPSIQVHADMQPVIHNQHMTIENVIKQEEITPTENTALSEMQAPAEEPPVEDTKPKVVVPNIEEELDFLSTDKPPKKPGRQVKSAQNQPQVRQPEPVKIVQPNRNGVGFMGSYLKFLNGERETSPPPTQRTGRRTWQKPIITSVQVVSNPSTQLAPNQPENHESVSSAAAEQQQQQPSLQNQATLSQPDGNQPEIKKTKSRKKKTPIDETITSPPIQSEQQQQAPPPQSVYRSPLPKKARPQMAMQMPSMYNNASSLLQNSNIIQNTTTPAAPSLDHSSMMSTTSPSAPNLMQPQFLPSNSTTPYQYQQIQEDPLTLPPRRETSTRKAKARGLAEIMGTASDNDEHEEPPAFADSDTDPVWTPQDEDDEEYTKPSKRKQRNPKSVARYKRSNILTAAVLGAGIDDEEDESTDDDETTITHSKKSKQQTSKSRKVSDKFSVGDFVILSSEEHNKCPVLWEIDGRSILKKYEPFIENGKMLYKSKSLFTTWRNNSMDFYVKASVKKCYQNTNEKIVELLKPPSHTEHVEFTEKLMLQYLGCKDRFEVYVQTLISQALDSSFFMEIMREQDEYFLPNITAIDTIIEACREKLSVAIKWPVQITSVIETWPNYRIIREMEVDKYRCVVCNNLAGITFSLSGQSYNNSTLLAVEADSLVASYEKNLTMCQNCITKAESLHKITHEKYNLFAICSKRAHELASDPQKGSTEILKELLADADWIEELFKNVRTHWTDAHSIERRLQLATPT